MTNFMILTQTFLGGTESNHEIRQPRQPVSKPGFQNRTGVAKTREGKACGLLSLPADDRVRTW